MNYRREQRQIDDILNDKTVRNIKGYINSPSFVPKSVLLYEKHFIRNNKDVIEYYLNHELDSYFETQTLKYFIISRGFGKDHTLFTTEVTYLNKRGKPYMCYSEVLRSDNVLKKHYRKINSKNQYSYEAFDSYLECLKYKPHIA
ncbi:hypothetical protein ITJ86_15475 [Winogradskyella sp. F6397]|uniref:Uncharacterized protein n=1 Tax=Winogradskyella marina TaxID=2785530 RepID=A0ABS0ELR4_9FLAO|nr:hypothetical protein [Winogradskyella marina]MBF8151307.1 hypothetical protein [Winogradskyella marina]